MSWKRRLFHEPLKLPRIASVNEEAVGIVAIRQKDTQCSHTLSGQSSRQPLRRSLAASAGVRIEGDTDRPGAVAKLPKLSRIQAIAQRTGHVAEARLPQHRVV